MDKLASDFAPLIAAGMVAAFVALVGLWAGRRLGLNPARDKLQELQAERIALLEAANADQKRENGELRKRIEYLEQRNRDLDQENRDLEDRLAVMRTQRQTRTVRAIGRNKADQDADAREDANG